MRPSPFTYVWRRDGNVVSTTSSYTTSDTGTSDFSLEVQVADANSKTAFAYGTVQVTGSGQIVCE